MTKQPKNETATKKERTKLKVFFLIFLSLLMPTMAGVIIGVTEITDQATIYFIQFIAIALGCLLALIWARASSFSFKELGFRSFTVGKWLVGILVVEAVAFVSGISSGLDGQVVLWLCLFMSVVGIFEELIYRGLIFHYLQRGTTKKAMVLSAFLFGIGHLINVIGGADFKLTLVQIIFACLFGLVAVEIVVLAKSIIPVIIWHACHNIISNVTSSVDGSLLDLGLVAAQCVILAVTAFLLWKQLFSSAKGRE